MPLNLSSLAVKTVPHGVAAGISVAISGPLGVVTGAFVGGFLGKSFEEFARVGAEKLFEAMDEGLLGSALEDLAERLKLVRRSVEPIQREALRLTLAEIGGNATPAFREWFDDWDACLRSSQPLKFDELFSAQVLTADPDELFRDALERLDSQGAAVRNSSLKLNRTAPPALVELVKTGLSAHFKTNLHRLLVMPENDEAWKQVQLTVDDVVLSLKEDMARIHQDLARIAKEMSDGKDQLLTSLGVHATRLVGELRATRLDIEDRVERSLREQYERSRTAGIVADLGQAELKAVIRELVGVANEIKASLASSAGEPCDAEILMHTNEGHFAEAYRLKIAKIERVTAEFERRNEARKSLAKEHYEAAKLADLMFDRHQAVEHFRQAWEFSGRKNPIYGRMYGICAEDLSLYDQAIFAYSGLVKLEYDQFERAGDCAFLAYLYWRLVHASTGLISGLRVDLSAEQLNISLLNCFTLSARSIEIYLRLARSTDDISERSVYLRLARDQLRTVVVALNDVEGG
jgi:hypothetical protein